MSFCAHRTPIFLPAGFFDVPTCRARNARFGMPIGPNKVELLVAAMQLPPRGRLRHEAANTLEPETMMYASFSKMHAGISLGSMQGRNGFGLRREDLSSSKPARNRWLAGGCWRSYSRCSNLCRLGRTTTNDETNVARKLRCNVWVDYGRFVHLRNVRECEFAGLPHTRRTGEGDGGLALAFSHLPRCRCRRLCKTASFHGT